MLSRVQHLLSKDIWSDYPVDQQNLPDDPVVEYFATHIIIHKSELYSYIIIPHDMTDTRWEDFDAATTKLAQAQADLERARRNWPGYPDQVQVSHAAASLQRAARSIGNILQAWKQHPRTKAYLKENPEEHPEAQLEATYSDGSKTTFNVRLGSVNFIPDKDIDEEVTSPIVTTQGSAEELEEWLDEELLRVETCLAHLPRLLVGTDVDRILEARKHELTLLSEGFEPSRSTVIHTTNTTCPIEVRFVGKKS